MMRKGDANVGVIWPPSAKMLERADMLEAAGLNWGASSPLEELFCFFRPMG